MENSDSLDTDFSNECVFHSLLTGTFQLSNITSANLLYENSTVDYPILYLSNCSNHTIIEKFMEFGEFYLLNDYFMRQQISYKNRFSNSTIIMAYVLTGITVTNWILLFLLLLSTNKKPKLTYFITVFYAIISTIILSQTTDLLKIQYVNNYQDIFEFEDVIINGLTYLITRIILEFFIRIAWFDILIKIYSLKYKRKLIIIGTFFTCLSVTMECLNFFFNPDNNNVNLSIKILSYSVRYSVYLIFNVSLWYYTIKKRNFAYNRKSLPLGIFSNILLIMPICFCSLSLSLNRSYFKLLSTFFEVVLCSIIWEWVKTIQYFENIYESKTIIGRKISENNLFNYNSWNSSSIDNNNSDKNNDNSNTTHFGGGALEPRHKHKHQELTKKNKKKKQSTSQSRKRKSKYLTDLFTSKTPITKTENSSENNEINSQKNIDAVNRNLIDDNQNNEGYKNGFSSNKINKSIQKNLDNKFINLLFKKKRVDSPPAEGEIISLWELQEDDLNPEFSNQTNIHSTIYGFNDNDSSSNKNENNINSNDECNVNNNDEYEITGFNPIDNIIHSNLVQDTITNTEDPTKSSVQPFSYNSSNDYEIQEYELDNIHNFVSTSNINPQTYAETQPTIIQNNNTDEPPTFEIHEGFKIGDYFIDEKNPMDR
ncbi:Dfg16p [Ascoidea rubescens DSM 1968]|uniref:PalH-domain-containing protein n=1 Tax=Ascoidea rubescens DSM 1968 TaxID=1344418 RepID=A0A1D2VKZ8_9ASCO|nr:PalH-domain-containing protein [Ascoidea rubescens DSM 1968]ODV62227.1 PalH-domain-containing protein [Ascoidea rubescens DSM 1968]